jgi:hypothetical protein
MVVFEMQFWCFVLKVFFFICFCCYNTCRYHQLMH